MPRNETTLSKPVLLARFTTRLGIWLLLAVILLIYTLRIYSNIEGASHSPEKFWDFKLFYSGSLDFFSGGSIYRPTAQLPFERIVDKNGNSPLGGLIFLPLAQLPLEIAIFLWVILSLGLLSWGISFIWRVYPPPKQWHWCAALLVFVYICYPVQDTFQLGSWGMIIAFLDFAAWYYARKGADGQAGVWLGLAVALRWQPALMLLYFGVMRRGRLILSSVLTIVVSYALAMGVFGPNIIGEFIGIIFRLGRDDAKLKDAYDGSLRAFLGRILEALSFTGLNLEQYLSIIWLFSALALVGCTMWRCRQLNFDCAYSLCLVCGLLLAPSSWMHYHVALLLPMVVIAQYQLWPVIYTMLIWLLRDYIIPFAGPIDFRSNPLLFGTLLSLSLFVLYLALYRGTPPNKKVAGL